MYKLNTVTVVNSKKIKVGKETFSCDLKDKAVVYVARMTECQKNIKIVLDAYAIKKTDYGFSIVLESEAIDAVVFDKKTQIVKNASILEYLTRNLKMYGDGETTKKLTRTFIDVAAAVEQSDIVIFYNDEATDSFIRRYVSLTKPILCERAPVVIDRMPNLLIPYLDKLDMLEKVMNETSPANLAYQLEARTLDANFSNNVFSLTILEKLTKRGVSIERVNKLEQYVASGKGTIEEIETLLKWSVAIKKLFEKTSGYRSFDQLTMQAIDLLDYGFSLTEIMNKISNTVMYDVSLVRTPAEEIMWALTKIMAYRAINHLDTKTMPENIFAELDELTNMYGIEDMKTNEAFEAMAKQKQKEVEIINNIAFICPPTLREIKRYSAVINPMSRKNVDLFLANKIYLFTIGNERGIIYDAPVFFFDENGDITMISGTLNDEQLEAVKILWNKIEERKV